MSQVCIVEGSGGKYRRAYRKKNRFQKPCTFEVMDAARILDLKPLPADVRSLEELLLGWDEGAIVTAFAWSASIVDHTVGNERVVP